MGDGHQSRFACRCTDRRGGFRAGRMDILGKMKRDLAFWDRQADEIKAKDKPTDADVTCMAMVIGAQIVLRDLIAANE